MQARGSVDHWQRFFDGSDFNLIQCAEQLEAPAGVLHDTLTNCTWQNDTYGAAISVAHAEPGALTNLGFRLGLDGLPTEKNHGNGIVVQKSALQYIENHDHERFVNHFGIVGDERRAVPRRRSLAVVQGAALSHRHDVCQGHSPALAGSGVRRELLDSKRWPGARDAVSARALGLFLR